MESHASVLRLRFWLFMIGCIGSRSLFTVLAAYASRPWLRILGGLALVPVIGWLYIVFIGRRDTGLEVFGDRIWWKNLRPIHLLLWSFFVYLAFQGNTHAWLVLAIDTLFGLLSFLIHHYQNGHLQVMLGM